MAESKPGGSVLQLFLMVGLIAVGIFYVVGWLNTGNPLWMLPVQPEYEPQRILIRVDGEETALQKGMPGFIELTDAFNIAFSDFTNADLIPLGLSDETLEEYQHSGTVIEIFYNQDIRFNTPVRMRNINHLLIPIEGRNANDRYVFMGANDKWLAGAMVMTSDATIFQALRDLGYIDQE